MRPKILCITAHDLDAPEYGATIRAKNVFRALNRVGDVRVIIAGACGGHSANGKTSTGEFPLLHVADFYPVQKSSLLEKLRREMNPRFLDGHGLCVAAADRERISHLSAGHDLVWIHGLRQADGCNIFRWANSVLDIDDIPSSISQGNFTQARPISEMFFHARQILNWRRREKILLERFTSICVCSEPDRLKLGGAPEIFVVPNGFSISTKNIARELFSPPRIGFVGTLGYEPNRSGLNWFLQRVWPLILRAAPQTRLRVAGEAPDFLKNARFQNVDRLGWLPDVETEMSTWSHTIVPLFIGGGTRIKIAEAFSRKCPVVSTTVGAYGYNVRDGQQILLADRPKEFASKCLWILENPNESKIIAENARQKFLANWTWDVIGDQVVKVAESVLQKNRRVETFSADVNV